jgi:Fic family protein
MNYDPKKPYNEIPGLPPKDVDLECKEILKKCIEARAALEGLKVAGDLIPNQTVLINIIPLLEAKDSSEIENIVTTTDRLFQYADAETTATDSATKEALRYRTALFNGYKSLTTKPLSTATAVDICSHILDTPMDIRKVAGTALANDRTGQIIYTPPVGENIIREKLKNWEDFMHNHQDLDPLIRMAAGHYQFEAIHPFTDGNGRTGRILNSLYLISEGLLHQPILYLSRYIIKNKSSYYSLLLDVTVKGQWEPWILYMLTGVSETAIWTSEKIKTIKQLIEHTADYVRKEAPKIYSRELVDIIFNQPYCRISKLDDAGIAKRQTAATYLRTLRDIGVLKEMKIGKEVLFIHPKLMELLKGDSNEFIPYRS